MKKTKILLRVILLLLIWIPIIGGMVFLPAWTLDFWQAWLFLAMLFGPMFLVFLYMINKDTKLLEKRLRTKEKRSGQKLIQAINTVLFVAMMAVAGLDHRYGWSQMPVWSVILSDIMMLIGYISFIRAMLYNEYASRLVEVQKGQKVIDTGPYSVVRHPMYAAGILMYLFIPTALGSFWALIPILLLPVTLIFRLLDEEKTLIKGLKGYKAYMKRVKYRLIPFVW